MARKTDIFRRIKLHSRRILRRGGEVVIDSLLSCPGEGGVVSLERCGSCGSCDALEIDGADETNFIVCRRMPTPREVQTDVRVEDGKQRSDQTPIADIMSENVVCFDPDVDIEIAANLLLEQDISGAPVADHAGRPLGIVSKTDLLKAVLEAKADAVRRDVRSTMTPIALTIPQNATVAQAAGLMVVEHVHRLPVVADDGRIVGIVASLDILRWLAAEANYLQRARG